MAQPESLSIREELASMLAEFSGQSATLTIPRAYLDLCDGDHIKALFFSQAVHYSKAGKWFYKSFKDWKSELCLSERQVRRVSKELEDEKVLETYLGKEAGKPLVHYRVCREKLGEWILTKRRSRLLPNAGVDSDVTQESNILTSESLQESDDNISSVGSLPENNTPISESTVKWLGQRFRSAGRKLSGPEKRGLAEWLADRSESEEQLEKAAAAFLADPFWAQKNFPVDAFKKQFQKYLDQDSKPPADANGHPIQPSAETPQPAELAVVDAMFEGYIGIFRAGGKPCGDKEREDAMPSWAQLTLEQRENTCRDAYRICKDADPKYIPSPKNHLRQKPWTREAAPRILPPPVVDKDAQRAIERAERAARLSKHPLYLKQARERQA